MTRATDGRHDLRRDPAMNPNPTTALDPCSDADVAAAARLLDGHDDYRVLRRVRPRPLLGRRPLAAGEQLLILLDLETTGLDSRRHEIIELGMVAVIHDADGVVLGVAEAFSALREPATALPAAITAITGLTEEMVAGQAIDVAAVEAFMAGAQRVCCHNAGFDRGFVEQLIPSVADLPWACSLREVDWAAVGTVGTKLEHILGHFGQFHEGHRAVHDCHALLEILARPHPAGGSILKHLIAASDRIRARVTALDAPFDRKDLLKSRGYRWGDGTNGRPKGWWIEIDEMEVEGELAILQRDIYRCRANPLVERITAVDRFKAPSAAGPSLP